MSKKARKALSLLLSLVLLCGLCVPSAFAAEGTYSDTQGHWAEEAIERWSEYGIVEGNNGRFNPNASLTRAQMAKVLANTLGLAETAANPFSDVSESDWFAPYVLRCYAAGVMMGDNGKANPNATITRQQAMVMLCRALGIAPVKNPDLSAFTDSDKVGAWAAPYVAAMVESGIVGGIGNGQLAPGGNLSRAALMTILDRSIVQYINAPGTYELTDKVGIILVAAGKVTLTGKTPANILVTPAADGSTLTFDKATVTGSITVQADNAKITSKNSKLPDIAMTGEGSKVEASTPASGGSSGGGNSGSSTPTYSNLTVAESKTVSSGTYQNVTITDAVGDGEVTLQNLVINGDLTVRGGGSYSIKLENCVVRGKVIMAKTGGETPRLYLTNTPIAQVEAQQPTIIEAADAVSTVTAVEAKADVEVKGEQTTVTSMTVPATAEATVAVTVSAGTVEKLEVKSDATVNAEGTVSTVTAEAPVTVASGSVDTITVPAGVTAPVEVTVSASASVSNVEAKSATTVSAADNAVVGTVSAEAPVTVASGVVNTITVPETAAEAVSIEVGSGAAVAEVAVSSSAGAAITNNGTVSAVSAANEEAQSNITASGSSATPAASSHIHTWNDGVETTAPTCTATGVRTLTCTVDGCGAEKAETIPAKGHTWDNGTVTKAPTLTERGIKTYTCTVCAAKKEEVVPAIASAAQQALMKTAQDKGLLTYLTLNDLGNTTRLEMAKLMAAFLDLKVTDVSANNSYTDCTGLTDQERGIIETVVAEGVMAPYNMGEFKPDAILTRSQAAEVFYRAIGRPAVNNKQQFGDVLQTEWYWESVTSLYNLGLITGTAANTFSPAAAADKESVLSWLVKGVDWTDPRTPVPAVTGFAFKTTPAALELQVQAPADMSAISRFRLEFQDAQGNWLDCGSFRGGAPILGDDMNGSYTRIRITSIPADPTLNLPGVFEAACDLTVVNAQDTAPASVSFLEVTNSTAANSYCIQIEGLLSDTVQTVVELAEDNGGNGRRCELGGDRFSGDNGTTKNVDMTVYGNDLPQFIPGGYYRVLEVKEATVTNAATAYLHINTRGDWTQVSLAGSITYQPVSDLHFVDLTYPVLHWTPPANAAGNTSYAAYLSGDGGNTWARVHSTQMSGFLPPYILRAGSYNAVKVATVVNGMEVAACEDTGMSLTITGGSTLPAATVTRAPAGAGYDYTVTGLSPDTPCVIFFGDGTGNYFRSIDFISHADGSCNIGTGSSNIPNTDYFYIQEYTNCAVSSNGKTASVTVADHGSWKKVEDASAVTPAAITLTQSGNHIYASWNDLGSNKYGLKVLDKNGQTMGSIIVSGDTKTENLATYLPRLTSGTEKYDLALYTVSDSYVWGTTALASLEDCLEVTVSGEAVAYNMEFAYDTYTSGSYTAQKNRVTWPGAQPVGIWCANAWYRGGMMCESGSGSITSPMEYTTQIEDGDVFDLRIITAYTLDGQTLRATMTPASTKTYTEAAHTHT